jgi:dipeptidyl aminopeptidase/acylaminoacyl peptidase
MRQSPFLAALPIGCLGGSCAAAATEISVAGPPVPAIRHPLDTAVLACANAFGRPLLSPNEHYLSIVVFANTEQGLAILDAGMRSVVATLMVPRGHQLEWYRWAGSGKLVLKLSTKIRFLDTEGRGSRLVVFNLADRRLSDLGFPKLVPFDDEVIHVDPAGQRMLVATCKNLLGLPEVREIMLDGSGAKSSRLVQPAKDGLVRWVADPDGVIRHGWGARNSKQIAVWYRDGAGQPLRRVADYPVERYASDAAFRLFVSPTSPQTLMLERGDKGRVVLNRRDLTSDGPAETLLAVSEADVTAIGIDRQGNLELAVVEDDSEHEHWFAPTFQRLHEKTKAALKGDEVHIVSHADDNSRMIVASRSERDPGALWLYEPTSGALSLLSEIIPGLGFLELGEGQFGRAMQYDLDDAMDWAVRQGIADPKRVCSVGASYGGCAALCGAIRNPGRYRYAASCAGVPNLKTILRYDGRFLTSDYFDRFRTRIRGEDDFDLDTISPQVQVSRLTGPVLIAHGDADVTVPFAPYEGMVSAAGKACKPLDTMVLKGEGHGMSRPGNRAKWLTALAALLEANNPAD